MRKYLTYQNKGYFVSNVLLTSVQALTVIAVAPLLSFLIDRVNSQNMELKGTLYMCLIFTIIFGVTYFSMITVDALWLKQAIYQLKSAMMKGILNKHILDFQTDNTGNYISALTNNVNQLEENYFKMVISIIYDIVTIIAAVAVLLYISWQMAVISVLLSGIPSLIPLFFKKKLGNSQKAITEASGIYNSEIKDIFNGFEVIMAYQVTDKIIEKHDVKVSQLEKNKSQLILLMGKLGSLTSVAGLSVQFLIIIIGGYMNHKGLLSIGNIIAVTQLAGQAIMPSVSLSNKVASLKSVTDISQEMMTMINTPTKINNHPTLTFEKELALNEVSFSYGDKEVLKKLSVVFEKGKKYAIIGESGSGKSTLLKLLLSYFPNYQGELKIDQLPYQSISQESIHQLITALHQETFFFDDTIEENIRLFRTTNSERLGEVIQLAELQEIVKKGDQGLKTFIKEGGRLLSGGERQRIAIARALYKGSQLLLLDEATSALDNQTAREIEEMLINLPDTTAIVVTHRLDQEMLKAYDEIIVMAAGEIVEQGSFEKLLRKQGAFYQLYQLEK
ncbi:ABC transporter ATP-binding protein [Vagococcus salmoninarum]|uniref:ABC transporter ATP-binding protein n=2 Tax=Vagococcus salmoninarum TaxID=2739 RepID=A0A429ZIP4_9ENTE|nr:ABC transporter ATP-binding protein [Vagococcus salmoninarum]RST93561.1 hypothetical protein CBF35_11785 [Vagococcus salmoninarum]